MDLVLAAARRSTGAAIALANDPDADRLGAAIPQPDGRWRRSGRRDRLAARRSHPASRPRDGDRPARHHDARVVVAARADGRRPTGCTSPRRSPASSGSATRSSTHPESRFVFGYEQALGYLVAGRPLDKDGITAAVLLAEVAAAAAEDGTTLQGRLDAIAERYGRHVIADLSVKMDPALAAAVVRELLRRPARGARRGHRSSTSRGSPRPTCCDCTLDGGAARAGAPERHRAQGQAVRRGHRHRPAPYLDALAVSSADLSPVSAADSAAIATDSAANQ